MREELAVKLKEYIIFSPYDSIDDIENKKEEVEKVLSFLREEVGDTFYAIQQDLLKRNYGEDIWFVPTLKNAANLTEREEETINLLQKLDKEIYSAVKYKVGKKEVIWNVEYIKNKLKLKDYPKIIQQEVLQVIRQTGLLKNKEDLYLLGEELLLKAIDPVEMTLLKEEYFQWVVNDKPLSDVFSAKMLPIPNEFKNKTTRRKIFDKFLERENVGDLHTHIIEGIYFMCELDNEELEKAEEIERYFKKM